MESEYIDEVLITIVKEFTKPQNFQRLIDEQVLANAVFYSFAIGALNNDEDEYETIEALKYVVEWIEDKEHLLKGFKVNTDEV